MKKRNNFIIILLLSTILIMSVGYAALATQININGTAEIVGKWDVKITNAQLESASEGCDASELEFSNTSVTFNAKLNKPGDKIVYSITIENAGSIDAKLANVHFKTEDDASNVINYETSELAYILNADDSTTFTITIEYDENTSEIPEVKTKMITGIIEYVQK